MWIASRTPHTTVSAVTSQRRLPSPPAPDSANDVTATAAKPSPQATSTTACLPARRATSA